MRGQAEALTTAGMEPYMPRVRRADGAGAHHPGAHGCAAAPDQAAQRGAPGRRLQQHPRQRGVQARAPVAWRAHCRAGLGVYTAACRGVRGRGPGHPDVVPVRLFSGTGLWRRECWTAALRTGATCRGSWRAGEPGGPPNQAAAPLRCAPPLMQNGCSRSLDSPTGALTAAGWVTALPVLAGFQTLSASTVI